MNKRTLAILFGALTLIGLAWAAYLTWDHYQATIDPNYSGGLCSVGSSCDISRGPEGEILNGLLPVGLPVAILAMAFYAAFGLVTFFRVRRPEDRTPPGIQLALAVLASLYSVSLAIYSLAVQGELCKLCTVLYGVNLLLVAVAWRGLGEPIGAWFKRLWGIASRRLGEPIGAWLKRVWRAIPWLPTAATAAVFAGAVVALYALYAVRVDTVLASHIDADDGTVATLVTEGRPSKGPVDAPVHLVEFADMQCPHCMHLFDAVEDVQAARPKELRVTFIHFPLDKACNPVLKQEFHQNACWLARVSDCAGRQGKFFEVAKALFDGQLGGTSNDDLLLRVRGLGVDMGELASCMKSEATDKRILADIQQGLDLEISGTPVFFINGHRMSGARSPEALNALIDAALKDTTSR